MTGQTLTLEPKRIKDVRCSLEIIGQAHTDLSKLCSVVCVNDGQSVDTFTDLTRIQRNINTVCQTLEAYPTDIALTATYEECDLAAGFLSCLILTIWTEHKLPTPQPLEWREAMVIYGVMFSAMHRLGNAVKACGLVTA